MVSNQRDASLVTSKMRYNSGSVEGRLSQGRAMTFSKSGNTTSLVACCIAFGLYWGSSYVGFSDALLDLRLTAFVEVFTRGASCILFALVLNKMRRIPLTLFIAMLVLQLCVVVVKTTGMMSSGIFLSLAVSVSYSLYSGFLIVCSAYCLYAFSSAKTLYVIVPIGFIVSYAYGMLAVASNIQPLVNALAGIAVPFILYLPMKQRRFLSRASSPVRISAEGFLVKVKSQIKYRSEEGPSFYFLGAIALFLVLIGVWFRIGANLEGALWLLKPQVGVWCIVALAAFLLIMAVTGGKVSILTFSLGTLGTFLGVLALTAFFWEEATDFIKGFSSIWLATFQSMLYILCRTFGKTNVDHAISLGIYQGAALIMLAVGNVVELCFFESLPFDKFSFLAFSFVFMFVFAVATIVEFYPFLKRPRSMKNPVSDKAIDSSKVQIGEVDDTAALAALCNRLGVTAREQDVIGRFAWGRSIVSIADDLVISKDTVKTHVKRAYVKLDVHNRRELQDKIAAESVRLRDDRTEEPLC